MWFSFEKVFPYLDSAASSPINNPTPSSPAQCKFGLLALDYPQPTIITPVLDNHERSPCVVSNLKSHCNESELELPHLLWILEFLLLMFLMFQLHARVTDLHICMFNIRSSLMIFVQ